MIRTKDFKKGFDGKKSLNICNKLFTEGYMKERLATSEAQSSLGHMEGDLFLRLYSYLNIERKDEFL